eukprot:577774_1
MEPRVWSANCASTLSPNSTTGIISLPPENRARWSKRKRQKDQGAAAKSTTKTPFVFGSSEPFIPRLKLTESIRKSAVTYSPLSSIRSARDFMLSNRAVKY